MREEQKKLKPGQIILAEVQDAANEGRLSTILAVLVQYNKQLLACYKLVYDRNHMPAMRDMTWLVDIDSLLERNCYETKLSLEALRNVQVVLDEVQDMTYEQLNALLGRCFDTFKPDPADINKYKQKMDFLQKKQEALLRTKHTPIHSDTNELIITVGNPYFDRRDVENHGAKSVIANTAFAPLDAIRSAFLDSNDIEIDDMHRFALVNLHIQRVEPNVYLAYFDVLVIPTATI